MIIFTYTDADGYEAILESETDGPLTLTVVPEGGDPEDAPCVYLSTEAAVALAAALTKEQA